MAQYTLGIPTVFVNHTRAATGDHLVASMALRVMNQYGALHYDWPAQSVDLGSYVAGATIPTGLFYGNVDVPDPTPQMPDGGAIYWSFTLINSGHVDYSVLVSVINNVSAAVVGDLVQGGLALTTPSGVEAGSVAFASSVTVFVLPLLVAGAIVGAQALLPLLTSECDGIVAAQGWALTAAQLTKMTAGGTTNWLDNENYPGTSSQAGCGTSNYNVLYEMSGPAVTVPNLVGQSTDAALLMARQAGLGMQVSRTIVDQAADGPTVASQVPRAGSLVPRATLIWVTVNVPPKILP